MVVPPNSCYETSEHLLRRSKDRNWDSFSSSSSFITIVIIIVIIQNHHHHHCRRHHHYHRHLDCFHDLLDILVFSHSATASRSRARWIMNFNAPIVYSPYVCVDSGKLKMFTLAVLTLSSNTWKCSQSALNDSNFFYSAITFYKAWATNKVTRLHCCCHSRDRKKSVFEHFTKLTEKNGSRIRK